MTKTTERHQALLHMLNARGYATIDELTKCFSVTPQTIRKDINTLAGQGKVQRFHGGVGMPLSTENILYEQRKKLFLPEKKAIAQMLAKHIPDGASLTLDVNDIGAARKDRRSGARILRLVSCSRALADKERPDRRKSDRMPARNERRR